MTKLITHNGFDTWYNNGDRSFKTADKIKSYKLFNKWTRKNLGQQLQVLHSWNGIAKGYIDLLDVTTNYLNRD